jgi:hypothetical protein
MNTRFWSENIKGTDHLEDIGVDGRITGGCDRNRVGGYGVDWNQCWAGSLKDGGFIDELSDYQLLKDNFVS